MSTKYDASKINECSTKMNELEQIINNISDLTAQSLDGHNESGEIYEKLEIKQYVKDYLSDGSLSISNSISSMKTQLDNNHPNW